MKEFAKLECARAKAACNLQHVSMFPNNLNLAHAIKHNIIGNHKYRREDIVNVNRIFSKSEAMLNGKVVKQKSKLPKEDEILPLPKYIMKKLKNITLVIDIHLNKKYHYLRISVPAVDPLRPLLLYQFYQ